MDIIHINNYYGIRSRHNNLDLENISKHIWINLFKDYSEKSFSPIWTPKEFNALISPLSSLKNHIIPSSKWYIPSLETKAVSPSDMKSKNKKLAKDYIKFIRSKVKF